MCHFSHKRIETIPALTDVHILKSATCNILDIWGCGYLSKTTRFRKESL